MNQLEQLRQWTTIVADTGDFSSLKAFYPTDATTNPTLVLLALQNPQYKQLLEEAVSYSKYHHHPLSSTMDYLVVNLGKKILRQIPGRVSIEIDARFSFDTQKSINRARSLIDLFEKERIDRSRILIKLAGTWEGIRAAQELEKESIHCNMTLIFSLVQAVACAEANATLISPFVGRISDWFKEKKGTSFSIEEDPGVNSVKSIYHYIKKFGYQTQVMGASFRSRAQILELAGCDLLTISPKLLEEIQKNEQSIACKLYPHSSKEMNLEKMLIDKNSFLHQLQTNEMANEKLFDGIRIFTKDLMTLEQTISTLLSL